MSTLLFSPSPRPLVTSGIAAARPPVPVLIAVPAASRLNQVSTVNCDAPERRRRRAEGDVVTRRRRAAARRCRAPGPSRSPSRPRPRSAESPARSTPACRWAARQCWRPSSPIPRRAPSGRSGWPPPAAGSSIVSTIAAWLRATFQMRASSIRPLKKPAAAPVEVIAVAERRVLNAVEARRERADRRCVASSSPFRIQAPRRAVVGRRRVIPDVVADRRPAEHRMVRRR